MPLDERVILLKAVARGDKMQTLEGVYESERIADFATKVSREEAEEVLLSGAQTPLERQRAGDALMLLLGNLAAQRRIPADEAIERLSLAREMTAKD